jgi:hypothetical protein
MKLIVERVRRVCLSGGIRGIRGYSITGNTQSLHLCIGSSNLPTSITSMTLAKIDRVLGKDHLSQRVRSILFYLSLTGPTTVSK